jgi:hypothetical protein
MSNRIKCPLDDRGTREAVIPAMRDEAKGKTLIQVIGVAKLRYIVERDRFCVAPTIHG